MIIAIENQSLLDIAIQEDGSVLATFEWAITNGFSITDDLFPGQNLKPPSSVYRNADVANYFLGKRQLVATGFDANTSFLPEKPRGIGAMIIGIDFIVG
jgi:capsid protein